MNIGEKLFEQMPGEPDELYVSRVKSNRQIFLDALNTGAGRKLMNLLYSVSHPMAPRFGIGVTPEEAAFLDGERSLIGLMWLNGTTEKTFNTES